MPEFNEWFPASRYGTNALNVKDFGAVGDGIGRRLDFTINPATGVEYATLAEAQVDFPSATSLLDYVDWAAITECFKQAFYHEDPPGTWVPNGTMTDLNKPVFFPNGGYVIHKPLRLVSVSGAHIFGHGAVRIHNELGGTAPDNSCFLTDGFQYSSVEGISFGTVGGVGSKAFDVNHSTTSGTTNNTNALTFKNCHFTAPLGIGLSFADPAEFPGSGDMCSEMSLYHCTMSYCAVGIYIAQWNALNYSLISCGGVLNDVWLQVSAGGDVCVQNGSLSGNGLDIDIGADCATIIATRTESNRFIRANGPVTILNCVQGCEGNQCTFVEVGSSKSVYMVGCTTTMGRLFGDGAVTIDNCIFNFEGRFYVLAVANSPDHPGWIRVVHQDSAAWSGPGTRELWLDGDELTIRNVTGTGAASINGTWIITKINHNTVDLRDSVFGGTYTNLGIGNADIKAGPRYHLVDPTNPALPAMPKLQVSAVGSRQIHTTRTKNIQLLWVDGGTVFDNVGATGEVVFTLPDMGATNWAVVRGTKFTFIVLAAQSIKIQVTSGNTVIPTRLFRAGGYATAGTHVSSNVIGNSIEIYQPDSPNTDVTDVGHRWVVVSETGTWTIAGTPT